MSSEREAGTLTAPGFENEAEMETDANSGQMRVISRQEIRNSSLDEILRRNVARESGGDFGYYDGGTSASAANLGLADEMRQEFTDGLRSAIRKLYDRASSGRVGR